MAREMSPERKRAVALACTVACMSGGPILLKGHPVLLGLWLGAMVVLLMLALAQLTKVKRRGQ